MTKRSRRRFLQEAAALGVLPFAASAAGCSDDSAEDDQIVPMFAHGIASGDPLADAVILWTRVSAEGLDSIDVSWEIATDEDFDDVIDSGSQTTGPERDYTVKVDVTGLAAATTYYYRFEALEVASPVGRTKTLPEGDVSSLRLGVMSCSNYAYGYFHGYRHAVELGDLDAIVHLGDYIYEYEDGGYGEFRKLDPPHEIVSLEDYRRRYAHYRSDPDLQALHARYPMIAVWDDHETTNDAYKEGAENHQPDEEGDFIERKQRAQQVYFEWIPIRGADTNRIYRSFKFGDLADLIMLDTRLFGREQQSREDANLPDRQLLGEEQEQWLGQRLQESEGHWCLLGNQIVISPVLISGVRLADTWDGYEEARQNTLDSIRDAGIENPVFLTGDIHASAAAEVVRDPFTEGNYDPATSEGSEAVELVCPGITSPFLPNPELILEPVRADNPHIRWVDGIQRGYFVLDVNRERVQATWYHYPDPEVVDAEVNEGKTFVCLSGTHTLSEV